MAASRQAERSTSAENPAAPSGRKVHSARLHVHWDRVCILIALVAVLSTVTVHSLFRTVSDTLKPVTAEASPPINVAPEPPKAKPTCPSPQSGVIHTAPAVGDAAIRTVALTFDDGPGPATPAVLDILRRNGIHATFFVIGKDAAADPEMLRSIVADGHAVGNHSWSHSIPSAKTGWRRSSLTVEIERTNRAILSATGLEPCLFRPPGGVVKGASKLTHAAGLSMILWSTDPRDWAAGPSKKSVALIRQRVAAGLAEEHPVILLHDGGGNRSATVAALQGIIDDYRAGGYQFVTLAKAG